VALALLGVTAAVALILAHRYHLGAAAIVVGILGGLPGLYLAWAALPGTADAVGSLDLATLADQLAVAVGKQWQAEAALRRLNDPYPLPLSWEAADPSLTDAWDSLVKLADSGAGWPARPPTSAATWATGPPDLAGAGGDLVEVLARVPTGRLVVLGEPGAGKTMLMVRLVLDLLARRVGGGAVPILASVGSWNPAEQDLRGWLAAQLMINHPALADPPSASTGETTQAAALLAAGLIIPILDGLDEIPEGIRGPAISRINDALRPGEQLVVSCRKQQWRDVVRPEGGVEVTLRAAAAVELRPLDADAVRNYLGADAAGPVAKARWDPVFKKLGTKAPVGQVLRTPLMVGLARAIYNPRPGEVAGALRDPAELCAPGLTNRASVEYLLFDEFIPAAYRHDPDSRWNVRHAQKWLAFLAWQLEYRTAGPDLAWWQLRLAVPRLARGLTVVTGVVVGGVTAVAGGFGYSGNGRFVWAGVVAVVGAIVGVRAAKRPLPMPAGGIRWKRPSLRVMLVGVGFGAVYMVIGLALRAGLVLAFEIGISIGALAGLFAWIVTQQGAPLDIRSATSPPAALARDRRGAIVTGVGAGVALYAAFIVLSATLSILNGGSVTDTITYVTRHTLVFWVGIGAIAAAVVTLKRAWPFYGLARIWLAARHWLPWQLMGFLADAHNRGVLWQAGAVYQFRHIELQRRTASRAPYHRRLLARLLGL
jgi:hypothetical protein